MTQKNPERSPLEASLPRDTASNSARLIATRWAAGVMVLLATAFCVHLLGLPLPEGALYLTGVVILAYNAALMWLTHRAYTPDDALYLRRIQRLVILQIALDWLSMTVFLHLTGGVTSPAIAFFFLHVVMVAILLPGGQSPYVYATLAVGVVILIAVLEGTGALPHYAVIPGLPPDLHTNEVYALAQVIFFAVALFATVFITGSIMNRLRERDRQIAALFQTTRDVSSTLDVYDVLEQLSRSAARALSVPGASIRLLEEGGDRLTMVASHGLSQTYLGKGPVQLSQSRLDREALTGGRPVVIREATTDPRIQYPKEVAKESIRSMLVAPIMGRRRPLGVLRAYSDQVDHFTDEDAEFMMAIARQGATAIENALAHDALYKANQERAQFVRMVTHELRAPVTGAQSLLRVLLRDLVGELTPKQRDIIARLEARLDALLELINDLLALAATKSVDLRQPLTAQPLQPAIQRVVDRLTPQAEEKRIRLTYDAPAEALTVRATEDGLVRLFDNLIGNAVKYTPPGGSVNVHVEGDPSSARVTVSDTGIGIPQDALAHIGEEFYRAPNAKQAGIAGTGLGMAIVRQLIDTFSGGMHVESAEGAGTTFTVTLPLDGSQNLS